MTHLQPVVFVHFLPLSLSLSVVHSPHLLLALLILIVFEQIVIGAIIENTPAERDGRLRPGDELISVDKNVVAGKPHKYVIDLMHAAARNGQVSLTVRRRVLTPGEDTVHCLLGWFCLFVCCLVFQMLPRLQNVPHTFPLPNTQFG